MQAIKEISGVARLDHTYLVEGSRCLAYMPAGTSQVTYFGRPLRFDRRGRKFVPVDAKIFDVPIKPNPRVAVTGSRGTVYYVDIQNQTCTCPGFGFRGQCRHLAEVS